MKIKLIGVGTSASVMVGKLLKQKIKDIDYTIISTSSRDKVIVKEFLYDEKYKERKFEEIDNDWKNQTNFSYFMLGEKTLNGATVVKDYESLELAIQESKDELDIFLERELKDTNIVILIAGLGGMNGSYVTPVVLEKIKEMNIYTIGILWTPFEFEGTKRNEKATKTLKEIEDKFDKIITINPNVLIINLQNIIVAFRNSDEIITKRISDTVNEIKNADIELDIEISPKETSTQYLKKAMDYGLKGIAIADTMSIKNFKEIYNFIKECKSDIKVVFGIKLNVINDDKNFMKYDSFKVNILAKNRVGLKNMYKLFSMAKLNKFEAITKEDINKYREGLLIGCPPEEEIFTRYIFDIDDKLDERVKFYDYIEIKPLENYDFYFDELQFIVSEEDYEICKNHDLDIITQKIVDLGKENDVTVIATSEVKFLDKKDFKYIDEYKNEYEYQQESFPYCIPCYLIPLKEKIKKFSFLNGDDLYNILIKNSNKLLNQIEYVDLFPYPKENHNLFNIVIEKANSDNIPYEVDKRARFIIFSPEHIYKIYDFLKEKFGKNRIFLEKTDINYSIYLVPKGKDIFDYTPIEYFKDGKIVASMNLLYGNLEQIVLLDSEKYTLLYELQQEIGINASSININNENIAWYDKVLDKIEFYMKLNSKKFYEVYKKLLKENRIKADLSIMKKLCDLRIYI
jgi:hypothetical protein